MALPDDLVARLEGKSSLGRLGLLIHSTAGFVDAGWDGHLTLELSNVANLPITLYPGMKIGQICFLRMTTPADAPLRLGRRSARSTRASAGPRPSRYFENFRNRSALTGAVAGDRLDARRRRRAGSGRSTAAGDVEPVRISRSASTPRR